MSDVHTKLHCAGQLKQGFSKREHLCGKKNTAELFTKGKFFFVDGIKTIYLFNREPNQEPVQLLVSVPKRLFKKAHTRNLLKRRIREAYRRNKVLLLPILSEKEYAVNIAFIFTSPHILAYSDIENKIVLSLQRLNATLLQKIQHDENIPSE